MDGSYLIGGIVGTGKSSLVDIAAAYSKKKTLTIHVNFYNEKEIIEKFSKIVLECLIDKIENESGILDDKLSKLVRKCKLELYYSIIVVDKGAIQVAYYVDRGSYDSDSFDAMEKLVNVSNQYGVDVKKMKIENYIDLNKDIRHIVKKYNAV